MVSARYDNRKYCKVQKDLQIIGALKLDKIELYSGIVRFSPILIGVDIILLIQFIGSCLYFYRKTGWIIDYWHGMLLFFIIIPVLIMYPFNASVFNIISVGSAYDAIEPFVDRAFLISVLGYLSIWAGRFIYPILCRYSLVIYMLRKTSYGIGCMVKNNIHNRVSLYGLCIISCVLALIIFYISFKEGYSFNPRAYFLTDDSLRPIYNFGLSIYPLSIMYLGIRLLQYNEFSTKVLFIAVIPIAFLLGTRSTLIIPISMVILFYLFKPRKIGTLFSVIASVTILIILAILLDAIRNNEYNFMPILMNTASTMFYGNNISDTRDFAWILAFWDKDYLYGKSYLAGLLSFIPRALSEYRQEWAISIYTSSLVGFDIREHAGLRAGFFGESFLNFGYIGVILLGIISGCILRYADLMIKKAVENKNNIIEGYAMSAILLNIIFSLAISVNFISFYVFLLSNIILYIFSKIIIGSIRPVERKTEKVKYSIMVT